MAATLDDVISALQDALAAAEELDEMPGDDSGKDAAIQAIAQIRAGRIEDAVTTLERQFLPRWKDVSDCETEYRKALAACPT